MGMFRLRAGAMIQIVSNFPSTALRADTTESTVKRGRSQAVRASARRGRVQRRAVPSGRLSRLRGVVFLNEAYAELRKAHWPTREQTARLTGLVVAISILMSIVLGFADYMFAQLFDAVAA